MTNFDYWEMLSFHCRNRLPLIKLRILVIIETGWPWASKVTKKVRFALFFFWIWIEKIVRCVRKWMD